MKKVFVLSKVEMFAVLTVGILTAFSQTAQAIPADVVKPAVEDKVKFAFEPANFRETTYEDGWINDRMQINVDKRLVTSANTLESSCMQRAIRINLPAMSV
jgi:hypothetical protein